jgi:hypothetical protein
MNTIKSAMSLKLYACFLPSDSTLLEDSYINRLAACFGKTKCPMIHVELLFAEDNSEFGESTSIHYGGQVFLKQKRFSRSNWHFRSIPATQTQIRKVYNFCKSCEGNGFNRLGFYLQPFSFAPSSQFLFDKGLSSSPQWYCSSLCCSALQAAEIFQDMPQAMHPHNLFEFLKPRSTPNCPKSIQMNL